MSKSKLIKLIISASISVIMLASFAACGNNEDTSNNETKATTKTEQSTDPTVSTDVDGRDIDDESFYGTWISDSGKTQALFGDFSITFNEDGTYDAVVTGESISGTWSRDGEQVTIVDPDEILPCNYTYTAKGGLKMIYEGTSVAFHR